MKIYRVEHAVSGQGPYGSWPRRYAPFSPEWQAGEDALTFPGNGSGGFAGMPEDARSGMHPLCGCNSVAALRAWFGRAWPYLVDNGFVLVEYEAARRFTHFPDEYRSNGEVMVARNAVRRIRATLLSDKLRQDVAALEEHMGGFNVASLRWYASREAMVLGFGQRWALAAHAALRLLGVPVSEEEYQPELPRLRWQRWDDTTVSDTTFAAYRSIYR